MRCGAIVAAYDGTEGVPLGGKAVRMGVAGLLLLALVASWYGDFASGGNDSCDPSLDCGKIPCKAAKVGVQ